MFTGVKPPGGVIRVGFATLVVVLALPDGQSGQIAVPDSVSRIQTGTSNPRTAAFTPLYQGDGVVVGSFSGLFPIVATRSIVLVVDAVLISRPGGATTRQQGPWTVPIALQSGDLAANGLSMGSAERSIRSHGLQFGGVGGHPTPLIIVENAAGQVQRIGMAISSEGRFVRRQTADDEIRIQRGEAMFTPLPTVVAVTPFATSTVPPKIGPSPTP
jgi:hypothetical protein